MILSLQLIILLIMMLLNLTIFTRQYEKSTKAVQKEVAILFLRINTILASIIVGVGQL